MWHADMNASSLGLGAQIVVFSPHQVVRVLTADQLSIETPRGDRLSALVLDRTAEHMTLSLTDGNSVDLSMVSDESLIAPKVGATFSSQTWEVN